MAEVEIYNSEFTAEDFENAIRARPTDEQVTAAIHAWLDENPDVISGTSKWTEIITITLAENTSYIIRDLDGSYDAVRIVFTNLWCVEGTTSGVAAAVNNGGVDSTLTSVAMGGFINSSSYPAAGCVEFEAVGDVCRAIVTGVNSAGNTNGCGVSVVRNDVSGGITKIHFSLNGYASRTMNAGAVIRIYGR